MVWAQSCGKTIQYPNLLTAGEGLIPAHAGKTCTAVLRGPEHRVYPRSRGENGSHAGAQGISQGSSPLTQGKLHADTDLVHWDGLIPAHTGKTSSFSWLLRRSAAHPRSRRENVSAVTRPAPPMGSSPLTRGKPCVRYAGCRCSRAHPRSRGENFAAVWGTLRDWGSSPLMRGKRLHAHH